MDTNTYETRETIAETILKVYSYGSRVYGCNTEDSDYDFIVIVDSEDENLYYSVEGNNNNFTVYSEKHFIKLIKLHKVHILECIFQSDNDPYLKYFELNLENLRRSFSAVSSNSYVKCKKKLKQGEVYIGLKSMFHSIRILNFGMQIARNGKIVDYASANIIYGMIFDIGDDWEELDKQFKPLYNSMKTLFRKLAPLEGE